MLDEKAEIDVTPEEAEVHLRRCDEADEFFDSGKAVTAEIRKSLADLKLRPSEIVGLMQCCEDAVDEAEDIIPGYDEDDQ